MTTQTTRTSRNPVASTAAIPAALAGSQNTPSSCASERHARSSSASESEHDLAAGAVEDLADLLAVHGLADADRAREGVTPLRRLTEEEARQRLAEPPRVADRVAASAVRQREHVGEAAELLEHLTCRRGLALDAVGIDRVDVDEPFDFGEPARLEVRIVEAAVDLTRLDSDCASLDHLAAGDAAAARHDDRRQARAGRVGGRRCRSVPGRRADDARRASLERARDGDRHPAILERSRRVRALPLDPELDTEPLRQARHVQQRRRALAQRDAHQTPRSVMTRSASGRA